MLNKRKAPPAPAPAAAPAAPLWITCVDCGGAACSLVGPDLPPAIAGMIGQFAMMQGMAPPPTSATADDHQVLGMSPIQLADAFTIRCHSCTLKYERAHHG